MQELRIEPKFRDKIPPLTEDEFKQLEANILEDGEVYEPIATWNGVIIDGHNRWKIVQAHPEIPYKVREMYFPDEWAAFDWMYKKQLGRRNLTEQQRTYMIGKMYEARKNSKGGDRRSNVFSKDQNDLLKPKSTAEAIGREVGVAEPTVKRSEKFANGVDRLKEVSPELADKVLSGAVKASQKEIASLAHAEHEQVKEAAQAIKQGKPLNIITENTSKASCDRETYSFGIDGLAEIVEANGESYVSALKNTLRVRSFVLEQYGAKERISHCIDGIIKELNNVREEYLQ